MIAFFLFGGMLAAFLFGENYGEKLGKKEIARLRDVIEDLDSQVDELEEELNEYNDHE